MNRKARFMLGTVLSMPIALGAASQAYAQAEAQAEDEAPTAEKVIVVTGSYIGGQSENGPLPVDVFTTEELAARGLDSPLEFIKTLPSVGAVLGDSNQYQAGGSQGVGSINLRSLGRERTLVLFNGRRFMPEPGDGAADTNLIPLFALQRVEVLKDGAASTYGSDAIAGVANFVTRRNFEGLEIGGDFQFVKGSDGNFTASVLAGKTFGDINIMVGAGMQRRSELPATERAFTQRSYAENPSGWSFLSNPGTYIPKLGPISQGAAGRSLGIGVDASLVNSCGALGGINGVFPSGASNFPVCRYSYVPFVNLIEETNRYQVYGQASVNLSDTLTFNAEALWARTELKELGYSPSYPPTSGPLGPGSSQGFFVPRSNPGYASFLTQTFAPTSPANASNYASILFFRPFALGGNPLDERGAGTGSAVSDAWRVAAGFEKEFSSSFSGQIYGTFLRSERTAFSKDIVGSRLQDALNGIAGDNCNRTTPGANGCLYFNPFINSAPGNPALGLANPGFVPGNENSQEVIDFINQKNGTVAYEEQFIVDLVFDGTTQLLGMEAGYAFGAQYRENHFVSRAINRFSDPAAFPCAIENDFSCLADPNDNKFPTGAFIFLGQYPFGDLKQSVYAFFAEGRIVPLEGLEVIGAVRFEDYGGAVGSTINPKVSAKWQMTDWLAVRGSIGDTFRGPLPGDLTVAGNSGVAGIIAAGNAFKATDTLGNPALKPETALTYSVGALVEAGGFNVSVDYWTYEFEGRFTNLPIQAIASAVAPGPITNGTQRVDCASPFTKFVVFAAGVCDASTTANDISRIQTTTVNGPDVKTSGLDFAANYTGTLGPVSVNLGANATYVLEYKFSDFVFEGLQFAQGYDAAGKANYDRAPSTVSKWRASGFASLGYENVGLSYSVTYIGGVDDNRCPATAACTTTPEFGPTDFGRRVGDYMQHDAFVTITFPLGGTNFQLRGGVENIFDRDPPGSRLEYGYDPFIGTVLGRTFKLGGKVTF